MPWIFFMLMLLNGAYFGWEFMQKSEEGARVLSQVVQEGRTIQLLSESGALVEGSAVSGDANLAVKGAVEEGAQPVSAARQCFNVGPFDAQPVLQQFISLIRSNGFHSNVEKRKVNDRKYWVFIPPFTNRTKAEEKLRDLKAQGITGFVVRDGVFVNAISLNNFSQKDLADAFLKNMQEAGVSVEYREITKSGAESWVYVSPAQSKSDLKATVDGFLAENAEIRKEISACDD
jgi:hypothetical protein